MDVALATCAAMPGLARDDRHLLTALRRRGLAAEPVVWEDPLVDWPSVPVTIIRSCWDYAWRLPTFLDWVRAAAADSAVLNPPEVVRWNAHKGYLVDLAGRGVAAVPTVVLRRGEAADLAELVAEHGWHEAVLKAAVGNSGRYARRLARAAAGRLQPFLDRALAREDMLLQPLVPSVAVAGELSLVFVDDQCTHGVRKRPAAGDFRVHDDYGGSATVEEPSAAALAAARRAMAAAPDACLYGRVDLVEGPDGEPLVMELELIEPELFFRFSAEAVERMADGIVSRSSGAARRRSRSGVPPRSPTPPGPS